MKHRLEANLSSLPPCMCLAWRSGLARSFFDVGAMALGFLHTAGIADELLSKLLSMAENTKRKVEYVLFDMDGQFIFISWTVTNL
jgi:hypothetical protein